jgi:hypothetical protein
MAAGKEPAMTTEFASAAQTCIVPVIVDVCTGSTTGTAGAAGAGGGVTTGAAAIVKFTEETVEVSP